jgi:hypothetical protein
VPQGPVLLGELQHIRKNRLADMIDGQLTVEPLIEESSDFRDNLVVWENLGDVLEADGAHLLPMFVQQGLGFGEAMLRDHIEMQGLLVVQVIAEVNGEDWVHMKPFLVI